MLMRLIIFLLTIIILPETIIAQNGGYSLFRSFTVADGLPSNHIYNCVEDNQGFLWVTTDAGIARFDGKHFQTFTTRDGLPDDEVFFPDESPARDSSVFLYHQAKDNIIVNPATKRTGSAA